MAASPPEYPLPGGSILPVASIGFLNTVKERLKLFPDSPSREVLLRDARSDDDCIDALIIATRQAMCAENITLSTENKEIGQISVIAEFGYAIDDPSDLRAYKVTPSVVISVCEQEMGEKLDLILGNDWIRKCTPYQESIDFWKFSKQGDQDEYTYRELFSGGINCPQMGKLLAEAHTILDSFSIMYEGREIN